MPMLRLHCPKALWWFFLVAAPVATMAVDAPAPVASAGLRELSTDRPDATESPFTVDAGHVQLEMDVASFTRNRLDGVRTTEWNFAPFNLRYGVTRAFELGVFVVPQLRVTEQLREAPKRTVRGMGDTTLRAKLNLRGNDGGTNGVGLIADVKLPTAAAGLGNDRVEGALTLPVAFQVGSGWEAGAMTSVEFAYTERGRRPVWLNTITFARELMPAVGGFVELTSATGRGAHVATFNCGLTRAFGPDLQIDGGINVGVSRTAPDLTVFAGVSRRF